MVDTVIPGGGWRTSRHCTQTAWHLCPHECPRDFPENPQTTKRVSSPPSHLECSWTVLFAITYQFAPKWKTFCSLFCPLPPLSQKPAVPLLIGNGLSALTGFYSCGNPVQSSQMFKAQVKSRDTASLLPRTGVPGYHPKTDAMIREGSLFCLSR